ncbi:MAG: hypothetical protein ACNA8R_09285 [Nitriliruptoraceae bacterium]
MSETSKPTLLRGADGELYFIPPGDLDAYRVPDEQATEVQHKLEELEKEQEDADVSGFSFTQRLSPTSLGLINPTAPMMGDNDKTVIINGSFGSGGLRFPGEVF